MSIIVTGGAGFIGSCIVRKLNDRGRCDVIIVDNIADTNKWMNIRNKHYLRYINKTELLKYIDDLGRVDGIIHMGACSSTIERNFDYLWKNNYEYSKKLWEYSAERQIPFIYASSASTYGDGSKGFDDRTNIDELEPMNAYGYSKQIFDQWVRHQAVSFPRQYVGLKFFNVYGPNEYYKGCMSSMIFHGYKQICETGKIKLFKSYRENVPDGEQSRDFVYVKDVCDVIMWFIDHPNVNGLFNVGTGRAQSFKELAEATFHALNIQPNIEYIDMPDSIKDKYQYYTKADMSKLMEVGYSGRFRNLEEGATDYINNYLEKGFLNY